MLACRCPLSHETRYDVCNACSDPMLLTSPAVDPAPSFTDSFVDVSTPFSDSSPAVDTDTSDYSGGGGDFSGGGADGDW